MKMFSRINMAGKIGIIVFSLLIPLSAVGFLFLSNQNAAIEFARKEAAGIRYYHPLEEIAGRTAERSALTAAYLAGDKSGAARLAAIEQEMTAQIAQMDQVDARYGTGSSAQAMWQDVKKSWSALAEKGLRLSPAESLSLHNALIDKVFEMKQFIADNWNLSLDPEATTYYMIDTAVMRIPELERDIGQLRTAMSAAAAAGKASPSEIRGMDVDLYQIGEGVKAIRGDLDTAIGAVPKDAGQSGAALRSQFGDKQARMETAVAGLVQFARTNIAGSDGVHAGISQVSEASQNAAEIISTFQTAVQEPLAQMLDTRAAHLVAVRNWTLGLSSLGVLFALALSWFVSSKNARQMKYAMGVFQAISEGKYQSSIEAAGNDEAAQVLKALGSMQERLRMLIESERAQAGENQRIRQALDKVSSYVMLADQNNDIIYMNDSLVGMFQSYASDIRKQLPDFDPNRLVGTNVDAFHSNPGHQNRLLSSLKGTHTAAMQIGGKSLRISATPVTDKDGGRLGTVVEWRDMTQESAVEKEVQFIVEKALDGDLTRRIRINDKTGFFEVLGKGINQLLDNTTDLVRQITVSAADVRIGADEISRGNANLSQRTEQQAASLEETASSMEQMTSTVRNNADNASQASQLASNARREAESGGEVVQAAVRAMQDISQSSRRIADIIGVIDEIAFQTNLLALNAAVEAARAGEQGRGFAVVASEVRSLAGRSASAAKEIKALIQDSVTKVADGTKLVDQSGETLNAIVMSVKKVADIVAEIAAANQEQSTGIEQVDKAVTQMDQLTQQNAALVEEVAAASETLRDQATKLSTFMERYRADNTAAASAAPAMARKAVVAETKPAVDRKKAPAVERRSGSRPWVKKEAGASDAAPAPQGAGSKAVGTDSTGDVWKEF